jgi:adenine/guanine phosphoribosyltransferase-like PRPP-binding protein
MAIIITEEEFRERLTTVLKPYKNKGFKCVTGHGRSGAIAAVYTSHFLGIPFIPYGLKAPLSPILLVDTAIWRGRTKRKMIAKYNSEFIAFYNEPPLVKFWYEELRKI